MVNKEYARRHQRMMDNKDFIVSSKPPKEMEEKGASIAEAAEAIRRVFDCFPTFTQVLENINNAFKESKEILTKEESMAKEERYSCPNCGGEAWRIFGRVIKCIHCDNDFVLELGMSPEEFNRKGADINKIRLKECSTGIKFARDADGWKRSIHNPKQHYELTYVTKKFSHETYRSYRFVAMNIIEAQEKADKYLGLTKGE